MTEGTKDKLYEFIVSDPFENWCLLPIGLSFQSKWHPVYGEYRIIIPFKEINDLLRKNGPLKSHVKWKYRIYYQGLKELKLKQNL